MKFVRTPHQIQANPPGRSSCFLSWAMTFTSLYASRNVIENGSHCRLGTIPTMSSRKTSKSSACRAAVANDFSCTISKSISRARSVFGS
ncbi:MAG: hypothetical protein DME35_10730 [Verrucomicrobia bacterium]|nr:MAG: hypothetical protein DME63_02820 [Verrucomicrobiota bacterium]PYK88790.1 MAG: hypothetical protein DME35_10730 [Verrucomicrobiota bacterium]